MRHNGAEIIIKLLEREGITIVSGIPGGANLPLYDALSRSPIRHVLARHEQGAGFIAHGMARSTGKTAVCFATSGPGVTNLVTALADAKLDSVPIVAITGQVATSMIGTDAFQEVDTHGAAGWGKQGYDRRGPARRASGVAGHFLPFRVAEHSRRLGGPRVRRPHQYEDPAVGDAACVKAGYFIGHVEFDKGPFEAPCGGLSVPCRLSHYSRHLSRRADIAHIGQGERLPCRKQAVDAPRALPTGLLAPADARTGSGRMGEDDHGYLLLVEILRNQRIHGPLRFPVPFKQSKNSSHRKRLLSRERP